MNSPNVILLQLALRPMMVVSIHGTDFKAHEVADFNEFFEMVKKFSLTNETELLINRGPGSYSGIRTTVAYALGLIHGGRIESTRVHSFTSFDYLRAVTGHAGPIFLKAWPRVSTGTLDASKGYFSTTRDDTGTYVSFEEIAKTPDLLTVGEEEITTQLTYRRLRELLVDPVGYRELMKNIAILSSGLEPLYINPVHIT